MVEFLRCSGSRKAWSWPRGGDGLLSKFWLRKNVGMVLLGGKMCEVEALMREIATWVTTCAWFGFFLLGFGIGTEEHRHIETTSIQYSAEKVESFVIDMDSLSSDFKKDRSNGNSKATTALFPSHSFLFVSDFSSLRYVFCCDCALCFKDKLRVTNGALAILVELS